MPLQCKNQIEFWKLDNMVMPLLNCYCSHYAFISHNEDHKLGKTIMCFTKACLLTVYVSLWVHGYLYFFKSSPLSFRYYLCDEENSDCTRTRIEEKGTWNQSNMWNFIDGVELPCTVMVYFGPVSDGISYEIPSYWEFQILVRYCPQKLSFDFWNLL